MLILQMKKNQSKYHIVSLMESGILFHVFEAAAIVSG